jgi:hypothetical protein
MPVLAENIVQLVERLEAKFRPVATAVYSVTQAKEKLLKRFF